jgi:hypothetical protein
MLNYNPEHNYLPGGNHMTQRLVSIDLVGYYHQSEPSVISNGGDFGLIFKVVIDFGFYGEKTKCDFLYILQIDSIYYTAPYTL